MSKNLIEQINAISPGSWVRIFIVVSLIVGAYAWGVIEGSHSSKSYQGHDSRYSKDDYREYRKPKMEGHMMHAPMDMSMADMSTMLEGKTGAELNKAFLLGMIPHHQGAIDMAKYLATSDKPELVKLGGEIISTQQREIDQMQRWLVEWGYAATGSVNK